MNLLLSLSRTWYLMEDRFSNSQYPFGIIKDSGKNSGGREIMQGWVSSLFRNVSIEDLEICFSPTESLHRKPNGVPFYPSCQRSLIMATDSPDPRLEANKGNEHQFTSSFDCSQFLFRYKCSSDLCLETSAFPPKNFNLSFVY